MVEANLTERRSPAWDPLGVVPYVPTSARRILDCACGDGERGRLLKERGAREVAGIEDYPDDARRASALLDRVLVGDLEEVAGRLEEGRYDCILCDDVLAQVRDAAALMASIVAALSPGGVLVATVPNLQYHKTMVMLIEGRWTYEDRGIMARSHIRFFTAYELVKLLGEAGLEICKCGALEADSPAALPRGEDGLVTVGRISIGPLNEEEYKTFLAQRYIAIATKTGAPARGTHRPVTNKR